MYVTPGGDYQFGDIISAEWLLDACIREDATPLTPFDCHVGKGRPPVRAYQPASAAEHRDMILAHGKPHRGILVGDDCELESLFERRGSGRFICAAVRPWPTDEAEATAAETAYAFYRHPLPPRDGFAGGVVVFRSLFAVAVDAVVRATPDPRVARLDDEAVLDFEIRWNAYATRRGPRSHRDNAVKLAHLLTANGDEATRTRLDEGEEEPEELDVAAANLLATALTQAWDLEGGILNAMADAYERRESPDASRAEILDALDRVREAVEAARGALAATVRPL